MEHRIASVAPGSIAQEMGIQNGDVLLFVNGKPIRDLVDYCLQTAQDPFVITLRRGKTITDYEICRDLDETIGLEFETDLMDKTATCANQCIFCFVDQLPKGLRPSLNVKDDDWRLSFLVGNYVTLTNVSKATFDRILTQKVSPLYISVHATDAQVRQKMLGHAQAGQILDRLKALAAAGIAFHTQIVLCPGYNDGAVLEHTLHDLVGLMPHLLSVAIVPVGLTAHRQGLASLRPVDKADATAAVSLAEQINKTLGKNVVFPADELYILSQTPIPKASEYAGFGQLEDGVGLVAMLDQELADSLPDVSPGEIKIQTLVTGVLASPILQGWVDSVPENFPKTQVITAKNHLFGEGVTVAGLLGGQDILRELTGKELGERVLLPRVMLKDGLDLTLDNMTLADLEQSLQVPIRAVWNDGMDMALALAGQ